MVDEHILSIKKKMCHKKANRYLDNSPFLIRYFTFFNRYLTFFIRYHFFTRYLTFFMRHFNFFIRYPPFFHQISTYFTFFQGFEGRILTFSFIRYLTYSTKYLTFFHKKKKQIKPPSLIPWSFYSKGYWRESQFVSLEIYSNMEYGQFISRFSKGILILWSSNS